MAAVISPPVTNGSPAASTTAQTSTPSAASKRSNSMPSSAAIGSDQFDARDALKRQAAAAAAATKPGPASSQRDDQHQHPPHDSSEDSDSALIVDSASSALSSSPETDLSSGPSTPTLSFTGSDKGVSANGSSFVPQYPYNVQMASHLNGPTPDDSEISSRLPSICVDYLSHDWSEDDVWTSWKAMTRHKAEIANGVRLENASWRTWAKQRGNLKTISPETLNWLKDSDVTWLYGPLHTAVDAVPPPKIATASDRLGLEPLKSLNKDSPKSKSMPLPQITSSSAAASTGSPVKTEDKSSSSQQQQQRQQRQQLSPQERRKERRKGLKPSKSILKHRSLSELLLNQAPVTSPLVESNGLEYFNVDSTSISHNRSDSNLSRHGSLRRNKPAAREASPDPSLMSDSSIASRQESSSSNKSARHISFNHRVEQCIALDQDASNNSTTQQSTVRYPSIDFEDEEMDDDDDVLTFKSSPKVPTLGGGALTAADSDLSEPAIIARLGPTTLKGTEAYPSPSPAVVYPNYPTMNSADGDMPLSVYGPPRSSYSTEGLRDGTDSSSPSGSSSAGTAKQSPTTSSAPAVTSNRTGNTVRSSWEAEEDDDYGMSYDYFAGPDVSVGDEYDMAQYGSQHLVPGAHNNYGMGSQTSASYTNSYTGETSPLPSPYDRAGSASSSSSTESSPSQSRLSSSSPLSQSPGRGPYSPPTSRDQPKRGILKPRSRETSSGANSVSGDAPSAGPAGGVSIAPRFAGAINVSGSPTSPQGYSPASGSPVGSPRGSSSSLSAAMAQAGVPIRGGGSSLRRNGSDNDFLRGGGETRGRSTSRGSSSSLERSNSSDRRVSSSPNTSYLTTRPITIPGGGGSSSTTTAARRYGSSDSLSSMGGPSSSLAREPMPGVPEASESESDAAAAAKAVPADDVALKRRNDEKDEEEIALVEDVEDGRADFWKNVPATVSDEPATKSTRSAIPPAVAGAPSQDTGLPIAPALIALPPGDSTTGKPTFRHPSPSSGALTGSTDMADRPPSRSLSNSPNLDPVDLASAHWSDETPVPSYARRSLLRAAARGSSSRDDSSNGRNSMDSGRSASSGPDDYGYGYYDDEEEDEDDKSAALDIAASASASSSSSSANHRRKAGSGLGHHHQHHRRGDSHASARSVDGDGSGLVGRTLEVAGTARDLIGAITKGLWNMGRRSTSAPSTTVTTANAVGSTSSGPGSRARSQDDIDANDLGGGSSASSVAMHKRAKSS